MQTLPTPGTVRTTSMATVIPFANFLSRCDLGRLGTLTVEKKNPGYTSLYSPIQCPGPVKNFSYGEPLTTSIEALTTSRIVTPSLRTEIPASRDLLVSSNTSSCFAFGFPKTNDLPISAAYP